MATQKLTIVGLLLLGLNCSASGSDLSEPSKGVKTINANILPSEVKVPASLWDLIEGKSVVENEKIVENREYKDLGVEETLFVGAKAILREKTPGVLGGSTIEVAGSKSGLTLDFAQILKDDSGTFYLTLIPNFEVDAKKIKVYFVSQARKRRIENQIWGSGCNSFSDITKYFLGELSQGGIPVNVTRFRHASLLGGYFLFVQKEESGAARIAFVRTFDSRAPYLECGK